MLFLKGIAEVSFSKKVFANLYVGVIYATCPPVIASLIPMICDISDLPNRRPHITTIKRFSHSKIFF
jgi:hypothetical protein